MAIKHKHNAVSGEIIDKDFWNDDHTDPDWSDLTNKPASSVANIDDAVSKKHTQGTDTTLGNMAAAINMNTHQINGVVDPTLDQDAATKKYVDDNIPAGALTYQTVSGTTDINTNSASYVDMTDMSLTVAVEGTYFIIASATIWPLNNNGTRADAHMQVIKNAAVLKVGYCFLNASHASQVLGISSQVCLTDVQNLAVNDVIKIQWKLKTGNTVYNNVASGDGSRTLTIIKLA